MCLVLFGYDVHHKYSLVLIANRDEYYSRPTLPAAPWGGVGDAEDGGDKQSGKDGTANSDSSNTTAAAAVFGGRDGLRGGTWLGLSSSGKLAVVTNYRRGPEKTYPKSRGDLTSKFLLTSPSASSSSSSMATNTAEEYVRDVIASEEEGAIVGNVHGGFNLLVGDMIGPKKELWWASNRAAEEIPTSSRDKTNSSTCCRCCCEKISPGIHGLSNHLLDTPWPKVRKGKDRLRALLSSEEISVDENALIDGLFDIMSDDEVVLNDGELPSTGIDAKVERSLSSIYISSLEEHGYGTRSSTVVLVPHSNSGGGGGGGGGEGHREGGPVEAKFIERSYGPRRSFLGERAYTVRFDGDGV